MGRLIKLFVALVAFGLLLTAGLLYTLTLTIEPRQRPVHPPSSPETGQRRPSTRRPSATTALQATEAPSEQEVPPIPADVSYSILKDERFLNIKRSIDVRLNKKVSEETLRNIALKLKAQDPTPYERTFICYVLPGMKVGAGAWATTHFNPDLKVEILGLSIQQERALLAQPEDPSREVIGTWLDERPRFGSRIVLFRENGSLFLEFRCWDGSSIKQQMAERGTPIKRIFRTTRSNPFGEFYLIDENGNLQIHDEEGHIATARKIH